MAADALTTVPVEDVTVTASGPIRHLCPYRDEVDEGTATITWSGPTTIELHSLRAYLDSYAELQISHEALARRIWDEVGALFDTNVVVTLAFNTAGLDCEVVAR